MHKVYKARFYNGILSKAFTVEVSFGEYELTIFFTDNHSVSQQLVWQKNNIKEIQYSSSIISLKYDSELPSQQLDITDPDFIEEYKNHFKVSAYNLITHTRNRNMVLIVFGVFVLLMVLSCFFVLPFFADIFARNFPKDIEISMGEKLYQNVLSGEEIDSAKTANINLFFKQMKVDGDYPVKITVVESNIENAFALPGGGIVVYDKILNDMNNYDELAALLAHEYSHVQLKHATRNIFRSLSGYIFISMFFGDITGVSAVIIQNENKFRSLKYGRELEHEADENGLKILKSNKIEGSGMAQLFKNLKKGNEIHISEYFSSHPDIDSRIDFVNEFQKQNPYTIIQNDSMKVYFDRIK